MTAQDPNQFLMNGGGAPGVKFADPGATVEGTIVSFVARQEREYDRNNPGQGALKFFKSGDPIMGIVVTLATTLRDPMLAHDDGQRSVYVEGQHLKAAVRTAVQAAGASGLEVGGRLRITFTHRENPADTGSRKYWTAEYTPAAQAGANAALAQGYPPAPAPQYPPAQAPAYPTQQPPAYPPVQAPAPVTGPQGYPTQAQPPAAGLTPEQAAALAQLNPTPVGQPGQPPF